MANSILGPIHFSLETGHLRSCLGSRAVDRKGDPGDAGLEDRQAVPIGVFRQQAFQFLRLVAGVPAGQRNPLGDVDFIDLLGGKSQGGGTVRQHFGQ